MHVLVSARAEVIEAVMGRPGGSDEERDDVVAALAAAAATLPQPCAARSVWGAWGAGRTAARGGTFVFNPNITLPNTWSL